MRLRFRVFFYFFIYLCQNEISIGSVALIVNVHRERFPVANFELSGVFLVYVLSKLLLLVEKMPPVLLIFVIQ